jgi:hypothetical protein
MHCILPTSILVGRHPALLSRARNDYISKKHL